MSFVKMQTDSREINQLQSNIATVLNPLLANPISNGSFLTGIALISGTTIIAHKLGRTPQGWMITDINGSATIYRSAALNASTLSLTSSAAVTVNLYVF